MAAGSYHSNQAHVAMADGAVKSVSSNIATDVWWRVGTRDGGVPAGAF